MDNEFDVAGLMEEAETRQAALDQVAELEEELARVAERLAETEMEAMSQQVGGFGGKCQFHLMLHCKKIRLRLDPGEGGELDGWAELHAVRLEAEP